MDSLPKEARSQEIGKLAGRALGSKLPVNWTETALSGDTDFGLDYLMQLKSSENLVSFSFYLQLKGTTCPFYNTKKSSISHDFKVSTLEYYHRQEPLVMVAVVDLKESEGEVWKCPIYYIWLDDDWFDENKEKLKSQKVISVKIPTNQLLEQSLDVYDFYAKRVEEKFSVSELKKQIGSHSDNVIKSIDSLTETISEKPILLKAVENNGEAPWIENPKKEFPTLLKVCSESLNANQLGKAQEILEQLSDFKEKLSSYELAEFYYQSAAFSSLQGNYDLASESLKLSTEYSDKDRYKLGYIESKFKLTTLPSQEKLKRLSEQLPIHDYRNAIMKAKCMAICGEAVKALELLKNNFPEKIIGQLMILTIGNMPKEIDLAIAAFDEKSLENDREKYIFHSFVARRAYIKSHGDDFIYNKVLPIQGKANLNLDSMREALENIIKAWDYAKKIGYPSDITIIIDISPLIYGYFNKLVDLYFHFEQMLNERPNNSDLIRSYTRLLFNEPQYEKTISLLERIKPNLDAEDCSVLILANYHLKRNRVVSELLDEYETKLLKDLPKNAAFIFCIAIQIAQESFDTENVDKYTEIVKQLEDGEALLAISTFIRNSNETPVERNLYVIDLFEEYIALDRPTVIAEQLFRCLNPIELDSAKKIIELSDNLLSAHELLEEDYFRLAQAYMTCEEWDKVVSMTKQRIVKGNHDPYWEIIQTVCLQNQGKPGLAYDVIKNSLKGNRYSDDHLKHYVNLCMQLGLLNEVEEALIDLLNIADDREEKLSFLSNLISIYSSQEGYIQKLVNCIRRFGKLVNQNDCDEEGQFLMYFLMSPKNDNEDEVKGFQERLAKYTEAFPNSPILKKCQIDLEGGADSLINSLNEVVGITDEQVKLWEENKFKIRNGRLPVPFFMLDRFLRDTRDIFTSWVLSANTPEEHLEFKLRQAPQLEQNKYESLLLDNKPIVIEDTSLLILNELSLLDKYLDSVGEFCILDSTFKSISKSSHPIAGSIYSNIPKEILKIINNHKQKLTLFLDKDLNPIEAYQSAIKQKNATLLTDDMNFSRIVAIKNESLISFNSFNVVENLNNINSISLEDKYNSISKVCSLGIHQPNMTIKLLADTISYFTNIVGGVDYSETKLKSIFDKIFTEKRDTADAINLFLRTLIYAKENSNFKLCSETLLSFFRGLLIRHDYKGLEDFSAFWFIYSCIYTQVNLESEMIPTSKKHVELWQIYKELIIKVKGTEVSVQDLLINIALQIFTLDEQSRELAYKNIKYCFTPITEEAEKFCNVYKEVAISYKLLNFDGLKNT